MKIYQNELGKACFQHNIPYGDFKDLTRRTIADKILHDKAFNIAKYSKYDKHQRKLGSTGSNSDIVFESKDPSDLATKSTLAF